MYIFLQNAQKIGAAPKNAPQNIKPVPIDSFRSVDTFYDVFGAGKRLQKLLFRVDDSGCPQLYSQVGQMLCDFAHVGHGEWICLPTLVIGGYRESPALLQ